MKKATNIAKNLILGFALISATTPAHAISIKATMDSSQILMGKISTVKLDIVDRADGQGVVLIDEAEFPAEVEVVDWTPDETKEIGNGLKEIKRALIIQAFDSGVYVLPPFLFISGNDTLLSNHLTIKVNPVDVSQKADINPIAPPQPFISKWYDFIPDFITDYWYWYLIGILVILGGICAYLILTNKVKVNILPQKRRLPPYDIAMNRLKALRDAHLWENGREKEYYTQLTDILREYLEDRFGINAMEMTSSQILKALEKNETTRLPHRYMRRVVEIADYVKFAQARPLPDDNVRSFNDAWQFVEDTKPVEVAPEGETDKKKE